MVQLHGVPSKAGERGLAGGGSLASDQCTGKPAVFLSEEPRTHVNIRHQPGVPSAELQEWLAVDPESHFEHFAKEQQGPDAPNFVYLPRCAGTHE